MSVSQEHGCRSVTVQTLSAGFHIMLPHQPGISRHCKAVEKVLSTCTREHQAAAADSCPQHPIRYAWQCGCKSLRSYRSAHPSSHVSLHKKNMAAWHTEPHYDLRYAGRHQWPEGNLPNCISTYDLLQTPFVGHKVASNQKQLYHTQQDDYTCSWCMSVAALWSVRFCTLCRTCCRKVSGPKSWHVAIVTSLAAFCNEESCCCTSSGCATGCRLVSKPCSRWLKNDTPS